jgi:hypothetical protein
MLAARIFCAVSLALDSISRFSSFCVGIGRKAQKMGGIKAVAEAF